MTEAICFIAIFVGCPLVLGISAWLGGLADAASINAEARLLEARNETTRLATLHSRQGESRDGQS